MKHAHRVDAVLDHGPRQRKRGDHMSREAFEHLEAALAGAELARLRVVRDDVAGIDVGPRR